MSNELARKFLEDILHSDSVDGWKAKLIANPEVREWAMKQFSDLLVERSNENGNENK